MFTPYLFYASVQHSYPSLVSSCQTPDIVCSCQTHDTWHVHTCQKPWCDIFADFYLYWLKRVDHSASLFVKSLRFVRQFILRIVLFCHCSNYCSKELVSERGWIPWTNINMHVQFYLQNIPKVVFIDTYYTHTTYIVFLLGLFGSQHVWLEWDQWRDSPWSGRVAHTDNENLYLLASRIFEASKPIFWYLNMPIIVWQFITYLGFICWPRKSIALMCFNLTLTTFFYIFW